MSKLAAVSHQSKFMDVADQLARQIAQMQPGDRLPTADEIRNSYRITIATASRVIQELRQRGLIHSRPGAGSYVASRKKQEFIICVQVSGGVVKNQHWLQFHSTLCAACSQDYDHYTILTTPAEQLPELIDSLENRGLALAGVVFFRQIAIYRDYAPPLQKRGVRTVFFGSTAFEPVVTGPACFYAEEDIIGLALEHLRNHGHTRIGCLYHSGNELDVIRHDHYRRLMRKAGRPAPEWSLDILDGRCFTDPELAQEKRNELRSYFNGITAVLLLHDEQALITMQSIMRLGFDIPGDLSVVSIDNLPLCDLILPPLDSVDLRIQDHAPLCIDILSGKIRSNARVEIGLAPRRSVGRVH